ncbi:peptidoglycan editing factor PgeF [Dysgonomonas sp. 520]|uniref:peptidoglycan editing factor PgeF n=1 Tax=Dysgonomonas sp. 520 TaxID=2302931 RepID=UPI0013D2EA2C|nr:peptidoglycan editing factor PgeF [Dysgonomonas sp. 520]NDW10650.1 peptidoglycan editing factor PgeF [Dysgonomonas sp. 520]
MKKNDKYGNLLQFENLSRFNSLFHFTTTIDGGVSKGNYATFNLGIYAGDDPDSVEENRNRLAVMADVDAEDLYFPYQTHGSEVRVIDRDFMSKSDLEKMQLLHGIDAVITNRRNICIGVSTADCVPILIYDPEKNILAAVHAGWRSTVARIAEKTIETMSQKFGCSPCNLVAGIGPSISPEYFEVGDEVAQAFTDAGFNINEISFRNDNTGKVHIDLWKVNQIQLCDAGVLNENIEIAALCTYSLPELFFSARRQTIHSGRMITGGVLR